jgi:large subunit ribosomal protein L24
MSIAKIQTGDQVKVTSGNYKGSVGQVLKIISKTRKNGVVIKRAVVSTVPKIIKYRKSMVYEGQKMAGGMFYTDRPIDISNLSLITDNNLLSKAKIEITADGKKQRILKKTGQVVTKNSDLFAYFC